MLPQRTRVWGKRTVCIISKTVKRIIVWCSSVRLRLFAGIFLSFPSMFFVVTHVTISAVLIDELNGENADGTEPFLQALLFISFCVFIRFTLEYFSAKLQDIIGYELAAEERIDVGEILRRVSLGYFQKNNKRALSSRKLQLNPMIVTFICGRKSNRVA